MKHGTNSGYQSCHCGDCRRAHKVEVSKWSSRVARSGHRRVPVGPTLNAVRYLRDAGITWREIAAAAGCPQRGLNDIAGASYLNVVTRDRLHAAMRTVVDGLAERVADAQAAVVFAEGRSRPVAVFPVGPMAEAVRGATGCLEERDRRYIYRGHALTGERVLRMCEAAGLDPAVVYGDVWFDLEEVS